MKAFISGFSEQDLQETIYPVLENGLYLTKDSRVICYGIGMARSDLGKTKGRIDLLVLGGGIMQKGKLTPKGQDNYAPALELANLNPKTPSIVVVNPEYEEFLESVQKSFPPNFGCTFSRFKDLSEEDLKSILTGARLIDRL